MTELEIEVVSQMNDSLDKLVAELDGLGEQKKPKLLNDYSDFFYGHNKKQIKSAMKRQWRKEHGAFPDEETDDAMWRIASFITASQKQD